MPIQRPVGSAMKDLFKLRKPIVPDARPGENREDDIAKLEAWLEHTGDMDLRPTDGPTGFYGLRLKESIEQFQKRNGLKVDGAVKPGGETIHTLLTNLLPPNFSGQKINHSANDLPTATGARTGISQLQRRKNTEDEIANAGRAQNKRWQRLRADQRKASDIVPESAKEPQSTIEPVNPEIRDTIRDLMLDAKKVFDTHDERLKRDPNANPKKLFDEKMAILSAVIRDADSRANDYSNKYHDLAANIADDIGFILPYDTEMLFRLRHLDPDGQTPEAVKKSGAVPDNYLR